MLTLVWVRHGETDWNKAGRLQGREDIPLNDYGRLQAKTLGQYLAKKAPWDGIITSPLSRARETAEIISVATGTSVPMVVMEDLIERGYGQISGLTRAEREARATEGSYPDMESFEAMSARVRRAMEEIRRGWTDARLIVVAHGGTINVVLSLISGGKVGTGKTVLANASFSTTFYQDHRWVLQSYNQLAPTTSEVNHPGPRSELVNAPSVDQA